MTIRVSLLRANQMRARRLLAPGLLVALVGCQAAIHGDWRLVRASPSREAFSIDAASFRPNGEFSASTVIDGVARADEGDYEFDGSKLTLRPRAGGRRQFAATAWMDRLEVRHGKNHAILQRAEAAKEAP